MTQINWINLGQWQEHVKCKTKWPESLPQKWITEIMSNNVYSLNENRSHRDSRQHENPEFEFVVEKYKFIYWWCCIDIPFGLSIPNTQTRYKTFYVHLLPLKYTSYINRGFHLIYSFILWYDISIGLHKAMIHEDFIHVDCRKTG